jgi:hypothetical protein
MSKFLNAAMLMTVFLSAFALATGSLSEASAEQSGTFSGTWIASGRLQTFDFVEGRDVGTFKLAGNVSLKEEFAGIEDFWAECVGLSDSVAGSSVRCVWRSLVGDKAYSVLSGQPLKEGVKVTGEFVGGTGSLKGLTGTFDFTWMATFTNQNQGIFTGHTRDLKGTYKIP